MIVSNTLARCVPKNLEYHFRVAAFAFVVILLLFDLQIYAVEKMFLPASYHPETVLEPVHCDFEITSRSLYQAK